MGVFSTLSTVLLFLTHLIGRHQGITLLVGIYVYYYFSFFWFKKCLLMPLAHFFPLWIGNLFSLSNLCRFMDICFLIVKRVANMFSALFYILKLYLYCVLENLKSFKEFLLAKSICFFIYGFLDHFIIFTW